MWLITCERCGPAATIWEKPGTGCKYVQYCPSCGRQRGVETERVENSSEHEAFKERAVKQQVGAEV
jgi:hypothetical protein